MSRLNKEREQILQPKRIYFAVNEIKKLGFDILTVDDTKIQFIFNSQKITFYSYSGWHTGKGIEDGRGWNNLKKQIKNV